MVVNARLFKIAYKKLKSSLYFDKTQSIVRDKLVSFETEKTDINEFLEMFAEQFLDVRLRGKLFDEICFLQALFAESCKIKM